MKLINKKHIYMLALVVICLLMIVVVPTYAKFPSNYTTDDDIVGLAMNFDLNISNIEEYEEVVVLANSSEIFNVEITNSTNGIAYYGVWYMMVTPEAINEDISIGKVYATNGSTSGEIESNGVGTVTIGIINNSDEDIKINIGVGSSDTGVTDIEYLGGKYLISGEVELVFQNSSPIASFVQKLYYDGSVINVLDIGDELSEKKVAFNNEQSILLDNNGIYRYYGSTPSNYVSFNGELWRIISVSNVKENADDEVGEQRVKIIKETFIGNYFWSSEESLLDSEIVNWVQSDLNHDLNEVYYNDLSESSKSMIIDSLWNIEFNDEVLSWEGKVGIIDNEDYKYGADLALCLNETDMCNSSNWLYSEEPQWIISSDYIDNEGNIKQSDIKNGEFAVRPVVYLSSNVYVSGGLGTIDNPYLLVIDNS